MLFVEFLQEDEQVFEQAQVRGIVRSTRSSSSKTSANMQIDVPFPAVEAPPQSSSSKKNILLEEKHLKFQNKTEKDAFKQLKTQRFIHTPTYDPALLHAIGMDLEFEIIFRTVGWEKVWQIDEPGSKLLTLEFLCTLQTTNTEVTFRLFGKDFSIPWREFSKLLGFNAQYVVDVDSALQDFDKVKF